MRSIRTAAILAIVLSLSGTAATTHGASVSVIQTNLVTDDPMVNPAQITDGHLINPWGVSFSTNGSGSPFWVSDNQQAPGQTIALTTLYAVNAAGVVTKNAMEVTIPGPPAGGPGSPTGQVFNTASGSGAFNGDLFLFVSEDGTVSGWRGALGTTAERFAVASDLNVYKGATEITNSGGTYLLAANFRSGAIDVIKGSPSFPNLTGSFLDPALPAGYAPFNIQLLGGRIYVTYALQDSMKHDDDPGAGNGFVSVFDTNGSFIARVASAGTLNSPWGLTIAPASFGSLAGDLLVGNFGDGRINAYSLVSPAFDGQLMMPNGQPLSIDGLWALTTGGGGVSNGNSQTVYFTAGPNDETHGIFGALTAVPEPSALVSGAIALLAGSLAYGRYRLRRAT
jgi:uncharacterized protein (TIGR03118 family)